ncbi:MAG: CAP domain-containing protein [Deltaproteobacteria bacterium]|nr:CAP domain-containing protein [Deltaproteobacteria bacterium]
MVRQVWWSSARGARIELLGLLVVAATLGIPGCAGDARPRARPEPPPPDWGFSRFVDGSSGTDGAWRGDGGARSDGAARGDLGTELPPLLGDGGGAAGGVLCKPCEGAEHCGGPPNYCLTNATTQESICGQDCASAKCPTGYTCASFTIPEGGGQARQCLPDRGTCKPAPKIPPLAPGTCGSTEETAALAMANQLRAQNGAGPLACDAVAQYAAREFSKYMCEAGFFAHVGPDGLRPAQRVAYAGGAFKKIGEICAKGALSPKEAFDAWLKSPGHKATLLERSFTHAGPGIYACAKSGKLWTIDFLQK